MEVKAQAKYIRIAPRKTRLLVGLVRGRTVVEARKQLLVSPKLGAKAVIKVLDSAVANAQNNFKLDTSTLVVAKAWVDEGPKIKRFTPRAQGRATPIRHRMSHITIVVGPGPEPVAEVKVTKSKSTKAKTTKKTDA
ncbi:MAG: 50S ribosomal protein L22 [Candidatus Uhrbacteria bacterium]|nr:50S ribosomal protein L22 [Candidatus Uhrbacteria bacterium]